MNQDELQGVARRLHARKRNGFYVIDCPRCGSTDSIALSERGFSCRSPICEWRGTDLAPLLAELSSNGDGPAPGTADLPQAIPAIHVEPDELPVQDFQGLDAQREINLIVSDGGVGKTTVALEIAGAGAAGCAAFDRFPCLERGSTLFISEEDSGGILRNHLEALCEGHGWPFPDVLPRVHLLCNAGVRIDQAHWQQHVLQEVERIGAGRVVIDNWYDVLGGEENSNSDIRPAIQFLRKLVTVTTVYVLAHAGKAGVDKRKIDRIRGASALFSAARVVYFLEHDERGVAVQPLKFSRGELPKRFVLARTIETDPDNAVVWRSARLSYLTAEKAQEVGAERLVQDALATSPGLMTKDLKDLAKGTGITAVEVSRAIRALENRDAITFDPGPNNSKYWRLTSLPENSRQARQAQSAGLPKPAGQARDAPHKPAALYRGQAEASGRHDGQADPTDLLTEVVE